MSSILKALKKLEDEKAAHQPDSLKIDSDILRGESSRRHSTTGLILAALLLFTGGSIATYLYMKKDPSPTVVSSETPAEAPAKVESRAQRVTSAPNATYIKTEQLPESIEVVPARRSQATVPAPKQKKQSGPAKPVPVVTRPSVDKTVQQQRKNVPLGALTAPLAVPQVVRTIPLLRVNGIAHQGGTADNVAVINGVPVSDGAVIEGVKVEEIQKDRVRFSYKGETFEIALGKSNR